MMEGGGITAFSHPVYSMILNELSELNNSKCTALEKFLYGGNSVSNLPTEPAWEMTG
jgi:hypothetical protein